MKNISLYIHIPFCIQICHYCDFAVTRIKDEGREEQLTQYISALTKEMKVRLQAMGEIQVPSLYLGGGTPSLLRRQDLEAISQQLKGTVNLAKDCEVTLEVNPETVMEEAVNMWKDFGINRISLGAQSFNSETLKKIGRHHTPLDTIKAVSKLKKAGLRNISLDLIYGLPNENQKDFNASLEQALDLRPTHLSLYQLAIEEKTVFHLLKKRNELNLPLEKVLLDQYETACRTLQTAGFLQYELQNFSQPSFQSRHNLGYWNHKEFLGFGVGAYSYIDGKRFGHGKSPQTYIRKCEKGNFSPEVTDVITEDLRLKEQVILGLRLKEGINLNNLKAPGSLIEQLDSLVEEGLLKKEERNYSLTLKGEHLSDWVSSQLV